MYCPLRNEGGAIGTGKITFDDVARAYSVPLIYLLCPTNPNAQQAHPCGKLTSLTVVSPLDKTISYAAPVYWVFLATKLAKLAVRLAPVRRQSNGWANFVVGLTLLVEAYPRLTILSRRFRLGAGGAALPIRRTTLAWPSPRHMAAHNYESVDFGK